MQFIVIFHPEFEIFSEMDSSIALETGTRRDVGYGCPATAKVLRSVSCILCEIAGTSIV